MLLPPDEVETSAVAVMSVRGASSEEDTCGCAEVSDDTAVTVVSVVLVGEGAAVFPTEVVLAATEVGVTVDAVTDASEDDAVVEDVEPAPPGPVLWDSWHAGMQRAHTSKDVPWGRVAGMSASIAQSSACDFTFRFFSYCSRLLLELPNFLRS